jgi:hypothetical protein
MMGLKKYVAFVVIVERKGAIDAASGMVAACLCGRDGCIGIHHQRNSGRAIVTRNASRNLKRPHRHRSGRPLWNAKAALLLFAFDPGLIVQNDA